MDQIELGLRQLIGAQIHASDLDRVGGELLDETGVDVDGRHVSAAVRDPPHQRAAARADLEAAPAGTDAEFVE